jgi:hypothetical protein
MKFLTTFKLELLVRAHEVVPDVFAWPFGHAIPMATIFSATASEGTTPHSYSSSTTTSHAPSTSTSTGECSSDSGINGSSALPLSRMNESDFLRRVVATDRQTCLECSQKSGILSGSSVARVACELLTTVPHSRLNPAAIVEVSNSPIINRLI